MSEPIFLWLDQSAWVNLAKEKAGKGPYRGTGVLPALSELAASDAVRIVLSAANYLETWHRRDWRSRHAVAGIMRDLTDYRSLAPIQRVSVAELERLLHERMGDDVAAFSPFGRGVRHTFDHPFGRLRLVESVRTDSSPEGSNVPVPDEWSHAIEANPELFEWVSLAGPEEDFAGHMAGLDRTPEHRRGRDFATSQSELRSRIESAGIDQGRTEDAVLVEYFVADLLGDLNDVCGRAGIDPLGLLAEVGGSCDMSSWIPAIVERLPTHHAVFNVLKRKHSNPQAVWNQHDFTDITGLAVPIVYCDAVVLDREWHHHSSSAHLQDTFQTRLLRNIDLVEFVHDLHA